MTVVVGKEVGTWDVIDEIGRVIATCYEDWAASYFVEEDDDDEPASLGDAYQSGYDDGMKAAQANPAPLMRAWLCTSPNQTALPRLTPVVVARDEARARQLVESALKKEALWPLDFRLCEIELGAEGVDLLPQPSALRRVSPEER